MSVGVTEALVLNLTDRGVHTVDRKLILSVVEDHVELLHKDISKDVLVWLQLVALDANLADILAIFINGRDQVVLGLNDVGTLTDKVETESSKVLRLAWTLKEACVGGLEVTLKVDTLSS